jgi:hypothetical protein
MQINSGAQFGVLEREAVGPPRRAGEFIEERDVVGAFQRQAHHFVDLVSIWPDHNAPSIGPYTVEDDRRGLCRPVSPTGGGATQRRAGGLKRGDAGLGAGRHFAATGTAMPGIFTFTAPRWLRLVM